MSVKISVIVPVYNVEKYLRQCIDSILSQTLTDIEVITINDGSPDDSLSILREYEKNDNRVVVIDKKNEGVGKARNDGIRAAKGEFVAFMDSDDYYPSDNVLETMYKTAIEKDVKIVGGKKIQLLPNGEIVRSDSVITDENLTFSANGLTEYKDYQYDYGYWQYIYNREMLISDNILFPSYKRFQDPPFFVRAMIKAGRFYAADCESYCYRMVPDSGKFANSKTMDFLSGLKDNLTVSRKNNLAKLHFLSAMRLYCDASFMVTQNLFEEDAMYVLEKMIKLINSVDIEWLKSEGYNLPEPFVPEVFQYAVSTASKYEKLRKNKFLRIISKIRK